MFSHFFIRRPVFAFVISIFITMAGLVSMYALPIAQYPEIAPPTVEVRAVYPGASAQVLEQTVAALIEDSLTGVEGLMYVQSSSSSNGTTTITATFEIGSDIDQATVDVNNRIKQVEARLPIEVRQQGVIVEKTSSAFLQVIAFNSPDGTRDGFFISNYLTVNVLDRLKSIPGTTNIQIFGPKDYSMRIWLQPDRMAQLSVTVGDVMQAVNEQNAQYAAGKIGADPIDDGQALVYTITSRGRLDTAEDFGDIIIRANPDGSSLRLKDIARVELASKNFDFVGKVNGKEATLVGIFLQSGANALDVASQVRSTIEDLSQTFPEGMSYLIPYDTTLFVEVSIREVVNTLLQAIALVSLVVFIFLQNWRATLIPVLAVPISLLGTFAGLYVLGYSINTLTLFGMVLSIGVVVDDAIVVLENIERLMVEDGLPVTDAAYKAMTEIFGPVIATSVVLIAVFVPIAFLGGLAGELYRQFAITISVSVALSSVVALTLTPALCVALLKKHEKKDSGFFCWFDRMFARITKGYLYVVKFLLRYAAVGIFTFFLVIAGTVVMWKMVPGSLLPDEDQGYYIAAIYMPEGTALSRTIKVVENVQDAIRSNPNNKDIIAFTGLDFLGGGMKTSAATIFVTQKHWDERTVHAQDLVDDFFMKTGMMNEAMIQAFNPPPIFGLGNTGGFEFYLQNKGTGGYQKLAGIMGMFMGAAMQDPRLGMVYTFWRPHTPQLYVDVDREKSRALGVPINEIFLTLSGALGSIYVNDFNKYGRTWQVLLSADAPYRKTPEDVGRLHVRSMSGDMIPVSALADIQFSSGPDSLYRYNNLLAANIGGSGAPGMSSGQTIAAVEDILGKILPPDFTYEWTGTSLQEKRSGGSSNFALLFGIVMVFLILAALYNSWSLPVAVMLVLPFGVLGALAAVMARGMSNDVYFQIGLVTLLGLSAKNAILIVEYALQKKMEGWKAAAASMEAARLRFRPIMMTSLTFVLGVMPLAFSTGAGAGARTSVGTGVMGGMIAATVLAIFFIPFFFKVIMTRGLRTKPEEFLAPTTPEIALQEGQEGGAAV